MKNEAKKSKTPGKRAPGRRVCLQVVPQAGGWAVKREGVERPLGHYRTQAEATKAAQETLRANGGALRVQRRDGRWRESFTLGRAPMANISAVEGVHLTAEMKRDFGAFDRSELSAGQRRRAIARKYGKSSA